MNRKPATSSPTPSSQLPETGLAFALLKASKAISMVLRQGKSLDHALAIALRDVRSPQGQGAVKDLAYHGLRHLGQGQVLAQLLSGKPSLQPDLLNEVMALGLGLLWEQEAPKYPPHTLVDQLVSACAAEPTLARAKGLVNACVRNFLRDTAGWLGKAHQHELARTNMPAWWLKKLQQDHPARWQGIVAHAQSQPPLVVRVNRHVGSPQDYVAVLAKHGKPASIVGPSAVWVHDACPVAELPGFDQGMVSIQDAGAQLAAPLLAPQNGQRILDACAAPGGKTGHLLELAQLQLTVLDNEEARLAKVQSNIDRIAQSLPAPPKAVLKLARAEDTKAWWDGIAFDAILADVPCTGSGVVRRHPDIAWLRRPADVANLSQTQQKILSALWSTLRPGGTLLLVTCSIFPEEGPLLAKAFIDLHPDAQAAQAPGLMLPAAPAEGEPPGADGFFYAKFTKQSGS